MKDPVDIPKKRNRFIPTKDTFHRDYKISDHAVEKYVKRFGNGNGCVRGIIRSVIDKGEVVMHRSEGNEVIRLNGVYAIVRDSVVRTVYPHVMYVSARPRIERNWEGDEVE